MGSLIGIFKKLGNLKELLTTEKTNLVGSINELFNKTRDSVKSVEAGLNYNTIKITKMDGTVENILIKIQGGSSSEMNVFKSAQHGGSYVAEAKTDSFTIEGMDKTKEVQIIYKNLFLIENVDYTINKNSGVVGLSFTLDIDEVVYYIIADTSYDYNELNNLPNIGNIDSLATESKEIVGAINEHEEQINSSLKVEHRNNIDLNSIRNSGTQGYCTNCTNTPFGTDGELLDYETHETTGYQEFVIWHNGEKYSRIYNNTWSEWRKSATEDDIKTIHSSKRPIASMSQISGSGYYHVEGGDSSFPYAYGSVLVRDMGNERVADFITTGLDKKYYYNVKLVGQDWDGWKTLATTDGALTEKNIVDIETDWNIITSQGIYPVHSGKGNNSPFITYPDLYDYGQLIVTEALRSVTQSYTTHVTARTVTRGGWKHDDGSVDWSNWVQHAKETDMSYVKSKVEVREESRDTPTYPTEYKQGMTYRGLKYNSAVNLDKDGHVHIIGYNAWSDATADVHEIAFCNGDIFVRKNISPLSTDQGFNEWTEWSKMATTTTMNISSNLLNGWTIFNEDFPTIVSRTGDIVTISGSLKDGIGNGGTNILTIPRGFRPTSGGVRTGTIRCEDSNTMCTVVIESNGAFRLSNGSTATKNIVLGISYVI